MRHFVIALAAAGLLAGAAPAAAAPCKDAKGKFVKCPAKAATPRRCKNAKGKFARCGAPGTTPA